MTFPTVVVEVGFGSTPLTAQASISWTDVTTYVLDNPGIRIKRGRNSELDDFQGATCSLRLKNADRRFDPSYSSGPHFGDLVPLVPIRVTATHNAVDYPRFMGYVTGWPQTYDPPLMGYVDLSCVDAFEVLRQTPLRAGVYAQEVMADSPFAWWRLGETAGAVMGDSSGRGFHGDYVAALTEFSVPGLMEPWDASRAIQFTGIGGGRYTSVGLGNVWAASGGWTVELWTMFDIPTDGSSVNLFVMGKDGVLVQPLINIYAFWSAGQVTLRADFGTGGSVGGMTRITEAGLALDTLYHIALTDAGDLYVNGVSVGSSTTTTATYAINGVAIGSDGKGTSNYVGTMQDVAIYPSTLSGARVLAHYDAGTAPWDNDTTGDRYDALFDAIGWPAADRNFDTGASTLGPAFLSADALSYAKLIERTEAGRFYTGADGIPTGQGRYATLLNSESVTSQATFGDGGGSEFPYFHQGLEVLQDRDLIRNAVQGRRLGGQTIIVEDSSSEGDYGQRGHDIGETANRTDTELENRLAWTLSKYKDPIERIESIVVKPIALPGSGDSWTSVQLWAAVLGADISHRWTVKRRPQGVGTVKTFVVLLEGYDEQIKARDWTFTPYLSPADTTTYALWGTAVWDTDLYAY